MILNVFSKDYIFLLRLLIAKCASLMITFFLYLIENFNQGEDQGPVTAAPYEVSKIIDHAFVDSLSDTKKNAVPRKKLATSALIPYLISKLLGIWTPV